MYLLHTVFSFCVVLLCFGFGFGFGFVASVITMMYGTLVFYLPF